MIFLLVFLFSYIYSFESNEVYSKILTDKFFRGIVADNLAENTQFVLEINCVRDTYSDMRVCIMDWIEKNPKKASELFSNKVKTEGEFKINSIVYEYYINPAFKEIIDRMQDAAKKSMSIENIRGLSSFLFDANTEYNNLKESLSYHEELKPNSRQISDEYFKINTEALRNEISNINNIFYNLSNYKVKDLGGIIRRANEYHNSFNNYFSTIKNSKILDKNNVDKMFRKLEEMKKILILKSLVIRLRILEMEKGNSPIFDKVSNDILRLSNSNINFKDFIELSSKIWDDIDNLSKLLDFIKRNEEIYLRLNLNYSCFLDYLFDLIDRFLLKKNYKNHQKDILKLREYFMNVSFSDSDLKDYIDNYQRAINLVELQSRISKRNRTIQYVIWDGFLPYDIYFLNKKRYFGLKIIQEGLFNYPYGKTIRGWNY